MNYLVKTIVKTCCFIGHRNITVTEELVLCVKRSIESLILTGVSVFIFGSRSQFDGLCLQFVTDLKEKYPHLKRIYVRAEYENINTDYENYLLESYDETYFSVKAKSAGKLRYVLRNQEMIDKSDICFFYYDKDYKPLSNKHQKSLLPVQSNSGTKCAFDYAVKKQKTLINVFDIIKI